MDLEELKTGKYYNATFTFKHLYKGTVIYEHKDDNKTVTVIAEVDYRSDLNTEETLSSLDCELDITDITIS